MAERPAVKIPAAVLPARTLLAALLPPIPFAALAPAVELAELAPPTSPEHAAKLAIRQANSPYALAVLLGIACGRLGPWLADEDTVHIPMRMSDVGCRSPIGVDELPGQYQTFARAPA